MVAFAASRSATSAYETTMTTCCTVEYSWNGSPPRTR
jgi:hypothetical protein